MWGVDVIRSVPRLLIYLLCASLFSPSTFLLVLVLGLTTWTSVARLVRAQMLALKDGALATAARALGASVPRTFLRHLVPQIAPLLVVSASLRFADTVLLESALSLLGLGSPAPAVSLGGVMASGRSALADAWWISACPGLLLCATLMALRSGAAEISQISDPPSLV
jgi:peptide/nickel transport system permease protein